MVSHIPHEYPAGLVLWQYNIYQVPDMMLFHSTVLRFAPPTVSTNLARHLKTPTHVGCNTNTMILLLLFWTLQDAPLAATERERPRDLLRQGGGEAPQQCTGGRKEDGKVVFLTTPCTTLEAFVENKVCDFRLENNFR